MTRTDAAPDKNKKDTLFPVYDCGSLAKLMPLTTNWTALNNKVDEMPPNGKTNVTIGLAWGLARSDARARHCRKPPRRHPISTRC